MRFCKVPHEVVQVVARAPVEVQHKIIIFYSVAHIEELPGQFSAAHLRALMGDGVLDLALWQSGSRDQIGALLAAATD
jgi:hypothetical protein